MRIGGTCSSAFAPRQQSRNRAAQRSGQPAPGVASNRRNRLGRETSAAFRGWSDMAQSRRSNCGWFSERRTESQATFRRGVPKETKSKLRSFSRSLASARSIILSRSSAAASGWMPLVASQNLGGLNQIRSGYSAGDVVINPPWPQTLGRTLSLVASHIIHYSLRSELWWGPFTAGVWYGGSYIARSPQSPGPCARPACGFQSRWRR